MGLFDFFLNKNKQVDAEKANEIPEDLFIENAEPEDDSFSVTDDKIGIQIIYDFLQADYESKGLTDAYTNPDEKYKEDNIQLIRYDLEILLQKVSTYYEDHLEEIDMHIETRSRSGLLDLVDELKTKKKMVIEHQKKLESIKKDNENKTGISQRIILSYMRGFSRGLSAITQSRILNKKL